MDALLNIVEKLSRQKSGLMEVKGDVVDKPGLSYGDKVDCYLVLSYL